MKREVVRPVRRLLEHTAVLFTMWTLGVWAGAMLL